MKLFRMGVSKLIHLEMSDWLYNAGIVGLVKIFESNGEHVKRHNNYIEFDEKLLEGFEEKYFKYFIDKYKNMTSWNRIVSFENYILNFDENNIQSKNIEAINKYIEYAKAKLKSGSYKSAYCAIDNNKLDLLKEEKNLSKITKSKKEEMKEVLPQIKKQFDVISKIIDYLKQEDTRKIILAKNIIYDVITNFWSDVSFLNKKNNKNNMYDEYKNYFVEPVNNYITMSKDKSKYKCFICDAPIEKISKPNSYDLTWINKIGVDMSRKTSHFWNFNGDSIICPICNLVYSCIPAGFTVIHGKGLFINQNSNINTLIGVNNTSIDNNITFEELEQRSYFDILDNINQSQMQNANKEVDNIQIVKLDTSNLQRPYTFNVMSKDKLKIISNYKETLKRILNVKAKISSNEYLNIYSEVLNRIYNNKNQFDLINALFAIALRKKDRFVRLDAIKNIIKINNSFLGGIKIGMYYNNIDNIQQVGFELRKAYIDKFKDKNADNKINGISYKLVNSLKTKNVNRFMDTLINSYMYMNKQIPVEFLEALKDDSKFQTIGYAFMLGLQGQNGKIDLNKEKKGENNNGK